MKRSDFINIGGQRIKNDLIVMYWEHNNNRVAIRTTGDKDSEYIFGGTIEEFEALLFDGSAKNERRVQIDTLKWVCAHCSIASECTKPDGCNFGEGLLRLEYGGDL